MPDSGAQPRPSEPPRTTSVRIARWLVWKVIDMPGLARIDLLPDQEVRLTFTTAEGCEPVGLEFIGGEVQRMVGPYAEVRADA